ncbi:hypothetical protein DFH09DRAFT_1116095 [Mycena vulgaris]|nr:hypothetical protein DFH09DRAFT_1116095 [Mycena vulgaris]
MPYSGTNRSLANLHDNRKPLRCWLARPRAFKYIPAARLSVAPAPVQHSVAARPLCHETTPKFTDGELETMRRNAMKPTHSRRTRYASFNSHWGHTMKCGARKFNTNPTQIYYLPNNY